MSLGAEVYSCNCKRGPLISVNLSRSSDSSPIVLAVSANTYTYEDKASHIFRSCMLSYTHIMKCMWPLDL